MDANVWTAIGIGIVTLSNGWLLLWVRNLGSKLESLRKRDHELANEIHAVQLSIGRGYVTRDEFRAEMKDTRDEFRKSQSDQTRLMENGFARMFDKLDGKADR